MAEDHGPIEELFSRRHTLRFDELPIIFIYVILSSLAALFALIWP